MAPTRGVTTYNVRLQRGIHVVAPLVGAMLLEPCLFVMPRLLFTPSHIFR